MPDTFIGLAVLVILLMPGVIFQIQADSQRPPHDQSSLRELISIAGVGAFCDTVVLLLFALARFIWPHFTPDTGRIEQQGISYIRLHYVSLAWWLFGLFAASCLLAWILGKYFLTSTSRYLAGKIFITSSWFELFSKYPDSRIYVGCELADGTYISGYLLSYSTDANETSDREIALAAPITHRPPGGSATILPNVGAVTVSAGQMKYMTVTYLPVP